MSFERIGELIEKIIYFFKSFYLNKSKSPVNVLAVSVAGLEVSLVDEMEVEVIDEP